MYGMKEKKWSNIKSIKYKRTDELSKRASNSWYKFSAPADKKDMEVESNSNTTIRTRTQGK